MPLNLVAEVVAALKDPEVVAQHRESLRPIIIEALAEALKTRETDSWLTSEQAAALLGYPTAAAFKVARGRNLELGALGVKVGRCWRFRRSDLHRWMASNPRRGRGAP